MHLHSIIISDTIMMLLNRSCVADEDKICWTADYQSWDGHHHLCDVIPRVAVEADYSIMICVMGPSGFSSIWAEQAWHWTAFTQDCDNIIKLMQNYCANCPGWISMRALYGALMCKQVNNNHLDNLHSCLGQLTSTSHNFNFHPGPNLSTSKQENKFANCWTFTSSWVQIN